MVLWKKFKALVADAAPAAGLMFAVCGMIAVWIEQSLTGSIFPKALMAGAGILAVWGLFRMVVRPSQEPSGDLPPLLVLLTSARPVPLWFGAACLLLISLLMARFGVPA